MDSTPPTQTGSQSEEETTKKFVKILQANGITDDVSKVEIKSAGLVGEGFISQSNYGTIRFTGDKEPLHLFVKTLTANDYHTKVVRMLKAFEKEAEFLVDYIPEAKRLCESKGHGEFMDIYPKCYYGDDDMIVLDNLVVNGGYFLQSKDEFQDMERAKVSLEALAKHHAISYAMIQSYGGATKFFERFPNSLFDACSQPFSKEMNNGSYENAVTTNIALLETHDVDGKETALKLLNDISGNIFDIMADSATKYDDEPLLVFNHGDYKSNNMFFLRDKETSKIVNHKIIDFQITRYNSPAHDIGYLLFTSIDPKLRRDHLHELLEFYLKNLKQFAGDLGCVIELTQEQLYKSLCRRFQYGFWMATLFLTGPFFAVLRNVDMSNLKDTGGGADGVANMFKTLIQEWIDNNSEKCAEMAKALVEVVNEYEKLVNGM